MATVVPRHGASSLQVRRSPKLPSRSSSARLLMAFCRDGAAASAPRLARLMSVLVPEGRTAAGKSMNWARQDSNLGRLRQRVYSPPPLSTWVHAPDRQRPSGRAHRIAIRRISAPLKRGVSPSAPSRPVPRVLCNRNRGRAALGRGDRRVEGGEAENHCLFPRPRPLGWLDSGAGLDRVPVPAGTAGIA